MEITKKSAPPDFMNVIRVSLNAIGITGVFAVVGYISLIAHQEFLGIPLEINSVTELSFSSAEFWFESTCVFLEQAQSHWGIAAIVIFLVLMLVFVCGVTDRLCSLNHVYFQILILFVIISTCACSLVLYEFPTMKLRNSLVVDIRTQLNYKSTNIIDKRTKKLWLWILDSKGGLNSTALGDNKDRRTSNTENGSSKLKNSYSLTLLIVVGGWIIVFRLPTQLHFQWMEFFRIIALIFLVLSTLLVPYTYGKIISPTTMPKISVRLQERRESTDAVGILKETERNRYLEGENLLVAESDRSIIVISFNHKNGSSKLIDIPRSKIELIEIQGICDALTKQNELMMVDEPIVKLAN